MDKITELKMQLRLMQAQVASAAAGAEHGSHDPDRAPTALAFISMLLDQLGLDIEAAIAAVEELEAKA